MNYSAFPLIAFMFETVNFIGGLGILTHQVLRETFSGKTYWKLISEQIFQVGPT